MLTLLFVHGNCHHKLTLCDRLYLVGHERCLVGKYTVIKSEPLTTFHTMLRLSLFARSFHFPILSELSELLLVCV